MSSARVSAEGNKHKEACLNHLTLTYLQEPTRLFQTVKWNEIKRHWMQISNNHSPRSWEWLEEAETLIMSDNNIQTNICRSLFVWIIPPHHRLIRHTKLEIYINACFALMKDGRWHCQVEVVFPSPLMSSVGMKGRALFLPDISLTARRYLSVLIRAVAGPVWLLPGCESNHTSSSPLSLIYGGKNRPGTVGEVWERAAFKKKKKKEKRWSWKEHIARASASLSPLIANYSAGYNASAYKLGSNEILFVLSLEYSACLSIK